MITSVNDFFNAKDHYYVNITWKQLRNVVNLKYIDMYIKYFSLWSLKNDISDMSNMLIIYIFIFALK